MPLRSVEAATRDDAIAAAREQFGPTARVVGVRRVRSGGVLGFFATERYVAEVDPELTGRPLIPAVPAPSRPARSRSTDDDERPVRAGGAPARNGAAAWAAEAARSTEVARTAEAARSAVAAFSAADGFAAAVRPSTPAADPASPASAGGSAGVSEHFRVDELAALLTAEPARATATPYSRASFPRASVTRAARGGTPLLPAADLDDSADDAPALPVAEEPVAPSPFTAALARMVSGDREVREAVQQALDEPAAAPREQHPARPIPPEPTTTAGPAPMRARAQEEETVGEQDVAPPPPAAAGTDLPRWAAAPEEAPPLTGPGRQAAIAEVLRAALAQGHSDEALAGILREMLAASSTQSAPSEPDLTADPTPTTDLAAMDITAAGGVAPLEVQAPGEAPDDAQHERPIDVEFELRSAEQVHAGELVPAPEVAEIVAPPATVPTRAEDPEPARADTGLWGEVTATPTTACAADEAPLASIWADAVPPEPVTAEPTAAEPMTAEPETDAGGAAEDGGDVVGETPAEVEADTQAEAAVEEAEEIAPLLARTASDLAPASLDQTSVLPPLSLLPPLPGSRPGRGRPPVPPSARTARGEAPPAAERRAPEPMATVTRLHAATPAPDVEEPAVAPPELDVPARVEPTAEVAADTALPVAADTTADAPLVETRAPLHGTTVDSPEGSAGAAPAAAAPATGELTAVDGPFPVVPALSDLVRRTAGAPAVRTGSTLWSRPPSASGGPACTGDVVARLRALGIPEHLLGSTFAADAAEHGLYAALTRTLAVRLPEVPELPTGAGDVLFVVGPGVETLRAARSLAAGLRLHPDRVQWATRGDLAGLAPERSRMTTIAAAIDRRHVAAEAGTVTIVAVDAPLRTDAYWMAQMLAVWAPVAVWAVVEATRKPEDLEPWLEGLPRVDALIVQETDLSADPAAVLERIDAPVALLDGVRATPHRWASLLCERLEGDPA